MGNRLYKEARHFVNEAKSAGGSHEAIDRAQNALSSAYANSTVAEQEQLRQMQNELDSLK